MLIIDYKDKFTVDIDKSSLVDRDDFLSIIEFFKKIFLSYNPTTRAWSFDDKRVDEVCLWFERQKYDFKFTPYALDRLAELQKQFVCERKIDRNAKFDESLLTEGTKLFDFQKEAINWLVRRNVSLNSSDTGAGKTIETIAVVSQLFHDNKIDSIVLITPDGTQYNWKRSFTTFSKVFKEEDFHILSNQDKIQPFEKIQDKKIIIISTHLLKDVLLSYNKNYKMGSSAKKIRWKEGGFCNIKKLWNKNSIACIVDESHLIKHSSSIKTRALLSAKPYFDYRFLLSATPNITKIEDIYTQFKFLDHSLLPYSEKGFKLWIAEEIDNYVDFNIKSYKQSKIEILRSKYPLVMIQMLKENLPEMKVKKEINPIYVQMTSIQKQLYALICEEEIEILYEEYDTVQWRVLENKLHKLTAVLDCPEVLKKHTFKNESITKLLSKWDMKYDPKFILLKSKLEDYVETRNEKVIIYDSSPHILNLLFEKFKKYNPLMIHGSLTGIKDIAKDRDEKERLFNTDPSHKIILLSSHTSSRSINLHKMCHRAIYYSIPFDAEEYRQGQDRVFRITSEHDVTIEPIVMDKSLDVIRFNRATNRISMNDSMMKEVTQQELNNLLLGIM